MRVKRALDELQKRLPSVTVSMVDISTPDGARIATQNNVIYPPAVFIAGTLFAKGKVDAERMIEKIIEVDGTSA